MTSALEPLVGGLATYGMANFRPERTGLPFIVLISQRDDARHAARVKVSPAPLNRDVLLRYWDGEIEYTEDALAQLRPV